VYWQVNALRDATVRALDQTDAHLVDTPQVSAERPSPAPDSDGTSPR